ncbi:MAG TPA: type III-B CRISPR module RAMP protein Cmr4 [bacterium]|nr:type III-B CRISPR module RAMP protein Cmr4 [bacterium]
MFKKAVPFFIHTISPLHAGSGSDLGIVDLPIQRERHTSFPRIEGSSLKGAMREKFSELLKGTCNKDCECVYQEKYQDDESYKKLVKKFDRFKDNPKEYCRAIQLTFGPESDNGDDGAGALGFADARILLFPVKSAKGVFAWITCPRVLKQFETDMNIAEKDNCSLNVPEVHEGKCIAPSGLTVGGKIILEEYAFEIENNNFGAIVTEISKFYNISGLAEKLVILSDDDFKDFVNLSTEVATRIRINPDTGTVAKGALFTEEYLPAETVLYSMALAHDVFRNNNIEIKTAENVIGFFKAGHSEYMQIGGNTTIGKGIVKITIGGEK